MNTFRLSLLAGIGLLCSLSSYIPGPSSVSVSSLNRTRQPLRVAGDPIAMLPQTIPFPVTGKASIDVNKTIEAQLTDLAKGIILPDLGPIKSLAVEPRYVAIPYPAHTKFGYSTK